MLRRLYIANFALIREMEVRFPGQLTVITGETGAGKSIFLEALGLALGKRADPSAIGNKEKKCVVEAEFGINRNDLDHLFREYDLDPDDLLVLRREISAEGRSRSFINDSAVSLQALKSFAAQLVDVHSQHETLQINEGRFQLDFLDAFAGSHEILARYREKYQAMLGARREWQALVEKEAGAAKERDYNQFLFTELQQAALAAGKAAKLTEESRSLENAETIRAALAHSAAALGGGDNNVLAMLAQTRAQLQSVAKYGSAYSQLAERLNSAYIELKDLYQEIEMAGAEVLSDDRRLDEISAFLDRFSRLLKKHQARDEQELLDIMNDLEGRLLQLDSLSVQIASKEKEVKQLEKEVLGIAGELRVKRMQAAPLIESQVRKMLDELAMPNAVLKVELNQAPSPGPAGMDEVRFLFRANKGDSPDLLEKIASGGELSRLMLCLKSMLAEKKKLPAIIFDEIDTGVSGEVAGKIGTILEKMSRSLQVITITHLPQMASRGDHHLFVFKKEEADRTNSYIRELDKNERVKEIAKMLSAGKPGESALQNARELLSA